MGETLHVPEGQRGDEVLKIIIPQLHAMADKRHRGGSDE